MFCFTIGYGIFFTRIKSINIGKMIKQNKLLNAKQLRNLKLLNNVKIRTVCSKSTLNFIVKYYCARTPDAAIL